MKKHLQLLAGMVLTGLLFSGCEAVDEPFNANDTEVNSISTEIPLNKQSETSSQSLVVGPLEEYVEQTINTYKVEFLQREIKGSGADMTTTFSYRVSGTQESSPALDSFYLEIPGCTLDADGNETLLSWTPTESSKLLEGTIKWNSSVKPDGSQEYSITYKGDVPFGVVDATVVRGSNDEIKPILGPCKDVFTLEGNNYIDSNEDGTKQVSESGILSSVRLYDVGENENDDYNKGTGKNYEILTLSDGSYSVLVLKGGNYDISVNDDLLGDGNYIFNTKSFELPLAISKVDHNISDQNFGFLADTEGMIGKLETGIIKVNTEPTKFWVDQVRHAGKKNSNFTVEQMNDTLTYIENLFLDEPFQFGNDKLKAALDILTRPIQTEEDLFLQQLLTAELNIVTLRGAYYLDEQGQIVLLTEFNDALLIYSEGIACCAFQNLSAEAETTKASDSSLLLSFNGSGGVN